MKNCDQDNGLTERQRYSVENPAATLVSSTNTLFTVMRLVQAARKNQLDPSILSTRFILVDEGDDTQRIQVNPAEKPLPAELLLKNVMYVAAAACFVQHDEIANQLFGGKQRFSHKDKAIRDALTVLYLVRCAFAHNPSVPTWLIAPRFRDCVYEVQAVGIHLDTANLHRKVGVIPRLGGWARAVKFLKHVQHIISPEAARMMDLPRKHLEN